MNFKKPLKFVAMENLGVDILKQKDEDKMNDTVVLKRKQKYTIAYKMKQKNE